MNKSGSKNKNNIKNGQPVVNVNAALQKANQLLGSNQLPAAEKIYRQILSVQPANVDALSYLGVIGAMTGHYEAAEDLMKKSVEIAPRSYVAVYNLASVYYEQGKYDQAMEYFKKALRIKPGDSLAINDLGNIYKFQGDFDNALDCYRRILELEPENARVWRNYVIAKTYTDVDDEDIHKLKALLDHNSGSGVHKIHLNFALGKIYEDLKLYGESFNYFVLGNKEKRKTIEYDINNDVTCFNAIKKTFDKNPRFEDSEISHYNVTPIFIVGMPRSGSTLIEQILSSHSLVYGVGELALLENLILQYSTKTGCRFRVWMEKAGDKEIAQIGNEYIRGIKAKAGSQRYVTDKMPGNFRFIGLIQAMFPDAKIIHSVRDPRDTCISGFNQLFTAAHKYSYDLVELGKYYTLYENLMSHWHHVFPGYILDVHYEELVRDQENQTRRILEFCGLPWEKDCLSFHHSSRPVATASTMQIRDPIYNSSIQRWKRYESWIQPLLAELDSVKL